MWVVPALLGLTLVALLVCESHQQFGQRVGPYDIVVQQVLACEDQGNGKGNLNISLYLGDPDASRKRKRLHRLSFSWPFTAEESRRMTIHADSYQKKSSDYLLMYSYKDNMCKTIDFYSGGIFNDFKKMLGLEKDGCVIPFGNYSIQDWEIPFELPTPMLEYGSYKGKVKVFADNEVFLCFIADADIKPKKTKL